MRKKLFDDRIEYTPEFQRFWEAYPPGRKQSKAAAMKSWLRAIKVTDAETIILAAQEYSQSPKGRSRYVQMPTTWLNGHCWEDDRAAWQRGEDGDERAPPKDPRGNMSARDRFVSRLNGKTCSS